MPHRQLQRLVRRDRYDQLLCQSTQRMDRYATERHNRLDRRLRCMRLLSGDSV